MQRYPILLSLAALVLLAVHACSSTSDDVQGCDPACAAGMICNLATKTCEPQGGTCNPPCAAANSTCSAAAVCVCTGGYSDCNTDIGAGAGGDGCECNGACNGTQCGGGPPPCQPTIVKACGDATNYCDGTTCVPCPAGKYNCDGLQDCEADIECGSEGCETMGDNTCASQNQFCDDQTGACTPCPAATFNCDRFGGDCECTTGCDGNSCTQQCTTTTGCADSGLFCDGGQCKPCATGRFNCDNIGGCECDSNGCDGTKCKGERTCDYLDTNNPCGDPELWCYENVCQKCSDLNNDGVVDYFNCNGTKGCECDKDGCNGQLCAGSCTGGEC